MFVGTLEPRKDVPTLVRAFAVVAGRHPDALLVLAGGRRMGRDAVDAAVAASGLGARVVRTGYVDDEAVPALLRAATAVVYPSLYEGFGLPALEALACGAPLVTTTGTAMEEVAGEPRSWSRPGDVGAWPRRSTPCSPAARTERHGESETPSRGLDIAAAHTGRPVADATWRPTGLPPGATRATPTRNGDRLTVWSRRARPVG